MWGSLAPPLFVRIFYELVHNEQPMLNNNNSEKHYKF